MRAALWSVVMVGMFALGSLGQAEEAKPATAADPAKEAAMAALMAAGSPNEHHKALEPLVGKWTYAMQWWMAPNAAPEAMTGTSENSFTMGGRFLKQKVKGDPIPDHPAFEGLSFIGYDNLRKEYRSIWLDNMSTSMAQGTGQYDAATKTLMLQGDFSCPMTGETHRWYRDALTLVDADHSTYVSYSKTPEGKEYKAMEIRYTRAP